MARKPTPVGPWFRTYVTILDNPKLGRLSEAQCWNWVKLLALTVVYGGLIPIDLTDVAYRLRKPIGKVRDLLQVFLSAGLLERCDEGYTPHDWEDMQFDSDVSTGRVRAFRERQRNVSVTVPENIVQRTDTEKKEVSAPPLRAAPRPKGSRWPDESKIPEEWIAEGEAKRIEHSMPFLDLRLEAERFANYWASRAGGAATKMDWRKTWLNWILDDSKRPRNANGNRKSTSEIASELIAELGSSSGRTDHREAHSSDGSLRQTGDERGRVPDVVEGICRRLAG